MDIHTLRIDIIIYPKSAARYLSNVIGFKDT